MCAVLLNLLFIQLISKISAYNADKIGGEIYNLVTYITAENTY
jgi:hypothetical protein